MDKIVLGVLALAMLAMFTVPTVVPAALQNAVNEVYLVPQDSNAPFCENTKAEIWVDATDFQSGQINITYDPTCANVTNWARNTTNFPMGTWTHKEGNDWITFVGLTLKTGKYMIGTLTIHCVNESEEGCETTLDFVEPSKLFDDFGNKVSATWKDGTFTCEPITYGVFDTGEGTYPSIFGTHTGKITLNQTITVSKLYTYPCAGTGGHTEYVWIHGNEVNESASWKGYVGDWHNITFDDSFFTLKANETYNYTIITGSYPQIIHNQTHTTLDGSFINCTEFKDANGKRYNNWIPAIKLL